jgi:hypothetical protein
MRLDNRRRVQPAETRRDPPLYSRVRAPRRGIPAPEAARRAIGIRATRFDKRREGAVRRVQAPGETRRAVISIAVSIVVAIVVLGRSRSGRASHDGRIP